MKPARNQQRVNPWLVLALISLPVFIGALDLTIVSAFGPELIFSLGLPESYLDDAAWIVSGYLLAYSVSMTFMGRVSDLAGRQAVYAACLLIFTAGSVLVAAAHQAPTDLLYGLLRRLGQRPDPESVTLVAIIIGRVVQALGAGALVPVSLALVGDLFPPHRRARPLGFIGAVDTLGWVLGHLYGGVMVQFIPWQGLFWINVPITLLALVLTWRILRYVPQQRAVGRFDFVGTLLIVGALLFLNVGLGANIEVSSTAAGFEELGGLPPYALPVLALALVCFVAFLWVERRVRDPLIHLSLFRRRNLSAGALTNLFVGFCLMIGLVSVPILVNVRVGDVADLQEAALKVGFLLSALTVPMALAAVPGGWLSEHLGLQKTTMLGLATAMLGFGLIWRTWYVDISDLAIALEMALVGIGLGLTFSPISAAVINAADEGNRGVASALVIILRLIGMTVSISSLTAFALQRVTHLVAVQASATGIDPNTAPEAYIAIVVQVLAELGLAGMVVCGLALIPASRLHGTSEEASAGVEEQIATQPGD